MIRDGFPANILDFSQEMGRCGRGRFNESNFMQSAFSSSTQIDCYHLIIHVESFVYLHERIFYESQDTKYFERKN